MANVRVTRVFTGLVAVALFGAVAQAQPPAMTRVESVPIDLATALAAAGGIGGDPEILVGTLPGWVANRSGIPANAQVLGSALIGTTVVAIIRSPE